MSLTLTAAVRANKPKRNVGIISAGQQHGFALQKNGRVWGWGVNGFGQLGDNTVTNRFTPVSILGAVKTFCYIDGGTNHNLAIDKNGRAWAWGLNNLGQFGDNSTTNRSTPVSVLGAVKTFCNISAGAGLSLAIDKNGRLWAWSRNTYGEIGDNTNTNRSTPVSVLGAIKTFCQITAAQFVSHAIDKNGRVWSWGLNSLGQLGDNTTISRLTPVSVLGAVKTFCKISAGINFAVAIDKNGRAWSWGSNSNGQLGDNSTISRLTPVSVLGAVKTFCEIDVNVANHVAIIDKNGRAWSWGSNSNGQLGDNSTTNRSTPVSVLGAVKTFCKITSSNNFTLAIDKNGRAWGWGINNNGQLGNNNLLSYITPVCIRGFQKTFCKIAIGPGSSFSLSLDKNGRVWAWGNNGSGQLGNNSTLRQKTPISVLGAVKTFCKISAGSFFSLAIDKNGRAWGWGLNAFGQLGDDSITERGTPVSVAGAIKTFCQISAGDRFSLAIDKNGRAWGWGYNLQGQVGDNSVTSRRTPVSVAGAVKTFCQISAGNTHSLAIDKNGRAWGWGSSSNGQLGDNSITSRRTPVSVAGAVKTFCQISGGAQHSLAIDKNGRAWGWGYNGVGQLGDNSVTSRRTPVSVLGAVKTFCKISAGNNFSLAIDKNGRAWGWGNNGVGQLGDNSVTSRCTPVSVLGAVKTFCEISAGGSHALAIDKNGKSWAWGTIDQGKLGIDKDINELTPIQICNI